MDEEFHPLLGPHSPLPHPCLRNEHELEVDPVRVNAFVNIRIRFDPVPIDIARVWLLGAKAPVNVNLLDPGCPKRRERGAKALQQTIDAEGVNPRRFAISSNDA